MREFWRIYDHFFGAMDLIDKVGNFLYATLVRRRPIVIVSAPHPLDHDEYGIDGRDVRDHLRRNGVEVYMIPGSAGSAFDGNQVHLFCSGKQRKWIAWLLSGDPRANRFEVTTPEQLRSPRSNWKGRGH